MKQFVKKIIACMVLLFCVGVPLKVVAAPSFGISASASTVRPNATFTVSVGGQCVGRVNIKVENGTASESKVWVEEGYQKITITAGSSGKVVVTATPETGMSDIDGNSYEPGARSVSVTISTPTPTTPSNPQTPSTPQTPTQDNKDKNSKLKSLLVSPGSLSPAFNADTTSYTVTVPGDTTAITISAATQSDKARVSTSGGKDLKLGPNEAKVVVTAENGSTTVYTLTIMCGEVEKINIADTEYTINESFTDEQIPAGFSREKVTYKERQYEALSGFDGKIKLLSLGNGETVNFYIYNEVDQSFYPFTQISIAEGKYIMPMKLIETETFSNYKTTSVSIQGQDFEAWKIDEDFSILYALNQDGEEVYYRYDVVDGTFQRYAEEVKPVVEDEEELIEEKTLLEEYSLYIIIVLGVLCVILLVTVIYFIATRNSRHDARKKKYQKRLEQES